MQLLLLKVIFPHYHFIFLVRTLHPRGLAVSGGGGLPTECTTTVNVSAANNGGGPEQLAVGGARLATVILFNLARSQSSTSFVYPTSPVCLTTSYTVPEFGLYREATGYGIVYVNGVISNTILDILTTFYTNSIVIVSS